MVRIDDLIADLVQASPPLETGRKKERPKRLLRGLCQFSKNVGKKPNLAPFPAPDLELQVPVDQIVLLEAAEALSDLVGAHRADAADGLQIAVARAHDGV